MFVEGIPDDLTESTKQKQHGVFIFDESQSNICDSQKRVDLFTNKCHHENLSTIVIFQNLFCEEKHRKPSIGMPHTLSYLTILSITHWLIP